MSSYSRVFRIVFVIFSVYLMRDAFFRWDGFKHYAPLYDFIASLALVSVLWSIIAAAAAFFVWLSCRVFEWIFKRLGLEIKIDHILSYAFISVLVGTLTWIGKTRLWSDVLTTLQLKMAILLFVMLVSVFIVWLIRNKTERWLDFINEKITPLVWLYGIFVFASLFIIAFQMLHKDTNKSVQQQIEQSIEAGIKRPNILLVTFDALSARNMSLYGYDRPTTPFIDKWSENAAVFTRAEAVSNYTAPTTASLMTGKQVWTHLRYNRMQGSKPVKADVESMPLVLKKNGYYNMMYIANIIASAENIGISNSIDYAPRSTEFWNIEKLEGKFGNLLISLFSDKFRLYSWIFQQDFILGKLILRFDKDESVTRFPPKLAFNSFLTDIDNMPQRPFFVWIHLDPPHYPYLPPMPNMGMFDGSEEMRTMKSQLKGKEEIEEYIRHNNKFPDSIKTLRARYDEFIRYCDSQFEDFINQLETKNILDNTVVILSSDHGESFEHNRLLHGSSLFEPETNIPLIIKEPHTTRGRVIDDVVSQRDIPHTILDLAGITTPSWMDGRSLAALMRGSKVPAKPVFSMILEKNFTPPSPIDKGVIAVWKNGYKLIHYLEEGESLLFNLKEDPDELKDLIKQKPKISENLLKLIYESLNKANERIVSEK